MGAVGARERHIRRGVALEELDEGFRMVPVSTVETPVAEGVACGASKNWEGRRLVVRVFALLKRS